MVRGKLHSEASPSTMLHSIRASVWGIANPRRGGGGVYGMTVCGLYVEEGWRGLAQNRTNLVVIIVRREYGHMSDTIS